MDNDHMVVIRLVPLRSRPTGTGMLHGQISLIIYPKSKIVSLLKGLFLQKKSTVSESYSHTIMQSVLWIQPFKYTRD